MAEDVQIELNHDNAVLLLAAAQELELDPGVVRTTSDNVFLVPSDVAKKAGLKEAPVSDQQAEFDAALRAAKGEADNESDAKPTAKKATAKRATAKKAASSGGK